MKKQHIGRIREEAIRNYISNTPGGGQEVAKLFLASMPYHLLKKVTEGLGLEKDCQKKKAVQSK